MVAWGDCGYGGDTSTVAGALRSRGERSEEYRLGLRGFGERSEVDRLGRRGFGRVAAGHMRRGTY